VEPDFLRPLLISLAVVILIVGTGATLLFFAFRAAGQEKEKRFKTLSAVVLAFVLIWSAIFFAWAIMD
jgi:hypothetical protein